MLNNIIHSNKYIFSLVCGFFAVAILVMPLTAMAASDDSSVTKFGIQRWPGVTVKTKVATLILNTIGYETETKTFPSSIIYLDLSKGDLDVAMGAWMPTHKQMLQPLLDKGDVIKLTENMQGAEQGLAVPAYTWNSGIHSVKDLVDHGQLFHHKIHAIEAGAGMTQAFEKAVKENYEGLGDWTVESSSIAGMLAEVKRATSHHDPIVFHGWKPHWMNIKFDIRYLKDKMDSKIAAIRIDVFTIARPDWKSDHPQVAKFLRQFHVSTKTQSKWIYEISYKKKSADEIAERWITRHMDEVAEWLRGVRTVKGQSARDVVASSFE